MELELDRSAHRRARASALRSAATGAVVSKRQVREQSSVISHGACSSSNCDFGFFLQGECVSLLGEKGMIVMIFDDLVWDGSHSQGEEASLRHLYGASTPYSVREGVR
jgi:hypothetical protein